MADLLNQLGQDHMGWSPAFTDYKQLLEQLKSGDEMIVYTAVMNLQQSLSVAQENTLQNFTLDQYIPALLDIMKRPGLTDLSNEINMMAVQCLTNLMDIFPSICNSIINHGGVKTLTELLERSMSMGFIDLNESCIKAFEKIGHENPYAILTSGALALCLNMMDFFEMSTQKRIIQLVANVCRHSGSEQDFDAYLLPIMPTITMLLTLQNESGMQQRTETISIIIIRLCESFARFLNYQTQFDKVCAQYQKLAQTGIFEGVIQGLQLYSMDQQLGKSQIGEKRKDQQQKFLSVTTVQNYLTILVQCCRYSGYIEKQLVEANVFEIINGFLPSLEDQKKSGISQDQFAFTKEAINLLDAILPERENNFKTAEVEKQNQIVEREKREIFSKIDQGKIVFLAEKILPKIFFVYDNNINLDIRLKALQIIDKMIQLFNEELLNNFIEPYSFAKFIYANISQGNPNSVLICLQMIQKLVISNSKTYTLPLIREGVVEQIKKYSSQDKLEQNLNLKQEEERSKIQQLEEEASILQAKAALLGQQHADASQREHFEQILQQYIEKQKLSKAGLAGKAQKSPSEVSTKILELSQILTKEYFENEQFMNEINSHCQEEFQLFNDLQKLSQMLLEEAQKVHFDYDQNKALMRQLQQYLTSQRNVMLYEFKQSGLLEALQIYLTCTANQAKYAVEYKKAKEKGEELKRSEEMQINTMSKEGKKITKKEARCFIQRLKMFSHFILNEKGGKRGINELVQLCHDILSQSENIIFEGQMGAESASSGFGGFQHADINQSVNALKQLTRKMRVNLIYDQDKKIIKSQQEQISPLQLDEPSKDQLKIDSPSFNAKAKSHNPAFLEIGALSTLPQQSKVYQKRNNLYQELKQVLIAVEQCASLYLLEDFLRNRVKTIDDVKSLKPSPSFLDQLQKNVRQETMNQQRSQLAKEVLEKALIKMREIFESQSGSRTREETEEFLQEIADDILSIDELTEIEQESIIKQLETQAFQMMDDLYAQEDQALEERQNLESIDDRLLSQGNEDELQEVEQKVYEFQRMLEKLRASFHLKQKTKLQEKQKPKKVEDEEKKMETKVEQVQPKEEKKQEEPLPKEKKPEDEDMEDQSEDVNKEEQQHKDVEMTDEEEEYRRFQEQHAKILQKQALQQQQMRPQEVILSEQEPPKEQMINEDLEELIKANGDIEFEFYSNGVQIQPHLTLFEIHRQAMQSGLPQLSKQTQQQKMSYYSHYGNDTVTIYFTIRDKREEQMQLSSRKDSIMDLSQGRRERTKSEAVDDISASSINSIVQQLIEKEFSVFTKELQEKLKQKKYSNEAQLEQSLKILKVINFLCKNIQLVTNQGIRFLVNIKALEDEEVKEPGFSDMDLQQCISQIHPNLFHHHKLDSFILKNIQDPFTLMGGSISESLQQIFRNCPFLFPFQTRELFFKLISFIGPIDMNRSIYFLRQFIKQRGGKLGEDKTGTKFARQKIQVDRSRILESGVQIMKKINKRAFIEFEFRDEEGTGMGPTLEFYALMSEDLKTKRADLWRKLTDNTLFPAPLLMSKISNEELQKIYELFAMMGCLVAKSIVDDRLIDLPISPLWWDILLGKKMNIFDLDRLDSQVYKVIADLQLLANKKREIDKQQHIDPDSKLRQIHSLKTSQGFHVEDLSLYFVLPGHDNIELKPDGKNTQVTIHNLQDYIDFLMNSMFHETIKLQTQAFKKGFNQIFPIESLKAFSTNQELEDMICGTQRNEDEWKNPQRLMENIIPDHGYYQKSAEYVNFIRFITEMEPVERRKFLIFVTGSPRLPHGGFAALEPKLTLVLRKEMDMSRNPDVTLPTVMTCQNYLKMPAYSSYEVLKRQFELAYNEGVNNFTLS